MPSKKGQKRVDHEDISLEIHTTESTSQRRSRWQNKAHLDGRIPKAVPIHAHKLKQQLDNVYRASRGREGVTRKTVKHFCESFDNLYDKLLPGVDGDPIAAAAVHVKRAVQHHDDKRARRIKSFRDELPPPFNEHDNIDPNLAIFVPVDDSRAVTVLRELEGSRTLYKLREAIHEAHWWFGEDGFVGWVIAVRQLPGGDLEVFTETAQHRNVLQEHSAWETVFLDKLVEESCRYGVSPLGLGVASVPKFPSDDERTQLIQQLFDWNISRIDRLGVVEDILSIEVRPTSRGNPIVVVNLAQPETANEFIAKGIQWGETTYSGRKYIKEWSLMQCEDCHMFGHTSVSCTEGLRCNKCGQRHLQRDCKSVGLECVNCGGPHRATLRDCPQRENEARRLRDLASGKGKWWPSRNRITKASDRAPKVRSVDPVSRPDDENQMTEEETPQKESIITNEMPDQDQHTAHNNIELPSTDAAETGKREVATVEEGDGNPEQEHTEAISTAKESEYDPMSDPRVQNIVRLLHGGSCPDLGHARGKTPEIRNEKSACKFHEQGAEIAHHQQPGSNKKSPAKARRQARSERRTRPMKDPHKQKDEGPEVTGVAEGETTGTPTGESNEARITYIVAPAAEGKMDEEVESKEAGHKQPQAVSKAEPKVIETTKPQPMKAPQDQKENSIRAPQDETTKPEPMKAPQDQDSIRGPQNSNTEQSAIAQKAILETPPILPPLIRRFQCRNAVGGN
ncbi:MAG: hypothetical protein L6R38_009340 [Xanthoria sp. 2 TBL-2021]|nr:MAG: hypothetical protein L6R38_009340 [Xanthoria sp. 2 TBL-2021]